MLLPEPLTRGLAGRVEERDVVVEEGRDVVVEEERDEVVEERDEVVEEERDEVVVAVVAVAVAEAMFEECDSKSTRGMFQMVR